MAVVRITATPHVVKDMSHAVANCSSVAGALTRGQKRLTHDCIFLTPCLLSIFQSKPQEAKQLSSQSGIKDPMEEDA